jgi:hypothetical protein
MKQQEVFDRYDYKQQAQSMNMRLGWILRGVEAHERRGIAEGKKGAMRYRGKVRRHLQEILRQL